MATEPGLSAHVAYYPADLAQLGSKKMPVVVWGNGSCLYAGEIAIRHLLTEIASHGYLTITGGPMAAIEQEVGPQSNPVTRTQGAADARPGAGQCGERAGRAPAARDGAAPERSRGLGQSSRTATRPASSTTSSISTGLS